MHKKTILVTGVLGFIFSNFVKRFYELKLNEKYRLVGIDKGVEKYNLLNQFNHPEYKFYLGDICDSTFIDNIFHIEKPDIIINGCAESFVCASISDPMIFIKSNVIGVQTLISACLKYGIEKFIQISTDEVMGQHKTVDGVPWTELDTPNPRNAYAASKYAAELFVKSAHEIHGLNFNISRSCNVYGPQQAGRNLLPIIILSILNNKKIPLHGDGSQIREYIHCNDKIDGVLTILEKGKLNEIYNISSATEISNLNLVKMIISKLGTGEELISFVPDRLGGSDWRYSLDSSKLKLLGWEPQVEFSSGVEQAIEWYSKNKERYK